MLRHNCRPLLHFILGQLHPEPDAVQGRLRGRGVRQRAAAARGHEGGIAPVPSPVSVAGLDFKMDIFCSFLRTELLEGAKIFLVVSEAIAILSISCGFFSL